MPFGPPPKLNLRSLILLFALTATLATLANNLLMTYGIQRQALVQNALEANRAYAAKLAASINESLSGDLERLRFSATPLGNMPGNTQQMALEAERLLQDHSFNTVLVANAEGTVVASKPDSLGINGQALRSREALQQRRAMVSPAFRSLAGNLIVFVSHPIWGRDGQYLGLIGGTIYLGKPNALDSLVSQHFHHDASNVYLVDPDRKVLFHPDASRVGKCLRANPIVDAVLKGESGAMQAVNTRGVEMLAGYASVPLSGWGVVAQQPLAALEELMMRLLAGLPPMSLLGVGLILWISARISRPLRQLAESAAQPERVEKALRVKAWYAEAWMIKRALLAGLEVIRAKLGQLDQQTKSNPLTGLANRRAMEERLQARQRLGTPFSVISLDIDHFKRVNDTFGHDTGDDVLRQFAELLRQGCRERDLPCRVGGEEFILLLPEAPLRTAAEVAERFRARQEATPIAPVGQITVSLGVVHWSPRGGGTAYKTF
ncbi:cell signaling regulator [Pseudomonas tohonis]|uniref:diguanylate cyclase n=1 Tax=Pseudomonas tohonis TaxID=2725477 RepID=A0A6J4EE36_9PSED|nr:sensor domain-containing diguanylate cyclase [Pseudomonas tohonis]BCG27486.1 cell signaling regulator [Pseudomonas tohonis]GJN52991.1 cell signaling regulator [Pseudomonas tohonis]